MSNAADAIGLHDYLGIVWRILCPILWLVKIQYAIFLLLEEFLKVVFFWYPNRSIAYIRLLSPFTPPFDLWFLVIILKYYHRWFLQYCQFAIDSLNDEIFLIYIEFHIFKRIINTNVRCDERSRTCKRIDSRLLIDD